MDGYAYGYEIVFNSHKIVKPSKTLYVNRVKNIDLESFSFQVDFETNQNRTIYLKSEYDFSGKKSLTSWIFVVEGVVSFFCNAQTNNITYTSYENYSNELMKYWLFHVVLPLYFTLNNTYYFLHTGSVAVEKEGILFMGDSFAGKSTLTDFFLKKGHRLLSDDKLATSVVNSEFICQASHCFHRPYRELETLGKKAENFLKESVKVGTIYWLTPVEADADIVIKELQGLSKFKVLRYSSEMDIALNQEERFNYITKMANTLKIFDIEIPRDMKKLDDVYEAIIKHSKLIKEKE